jgi:hypothetical protein
MLKKKNFSLTGSGDPPTLSRQSNPCFITCDLNERRSNFMSSLCVMMFSNLPAVLAPVHAMEQMPL